MSKSCHEVKKLLSPYIDDMLNAEQEEAVKAHLAVCEACRRDYELLSGVLRTAGTLPAIEATDSFRAGLHAKLIAAAEEKSLAVQPKKRPLWRLASGVAAAAAVIALSVAAFSNLPRLDSLPDQADMTPNVTPSLTQQQETEPTNQPDLTAPPTAESTAEGVTESADGRSSAAAPGQFDATADKAGEQPVQRQAAPPSATPEPPQTANVPVTSAVMPESAADAGEKVAPSEQADGAQQTESAAYKAMPAVGSDSLNDSTAANDGGRGGSGASAGGSLRIASMAVVKTTVRYTLTADSCRAARALLQDYHQDGSGILVPNEDFAEICRSLEALPGYVSNTVETETPDSPTEEQTALYANYVWIVMTEAS